MAAATIYALVPHSATPYSVMIQAYGGVGAVLLPSATLISYLVEGPLKAYLQRLPVASWGDLNVTGARGNKIRIYDSALSSTGAAETRNTAFTVAWVGNANPALAGIAFNLVAAGGEGQAAARTIEIRYNHSATA
jgi:hypothetical protein